MKKVICMMVAAAGLLVTPSCKNVASLDTVSHDSVGSVGTVYYGTVTSARNVTIDASDTDKDLGTIAGGALGAALGSLWGGGRARAVTTVGMGLVGAAAGRGVGKYTTQTQGQVLTIKLDGSGRRHTVTQPVYKGVGYIPVGAHGQLQVGGNSKFLPDGYY
ncbi:MAG: hypothetical protein Q4A24_08675 [Akkermansia sp.]|nr:hypothetical protein [Akkermansia sp.]